MSSLSFAACGHKGALAHFIWVWCGLGLAAAALEAAANTLVVKRPSSELARSSPGKKESGASDKQQADAASSAIRQCRCCWTACAESHFLVCKLRFFRVSSVRLCARRRRAMQTRIRALRCRIAGGEDEAATATRTKVRNCIALTSIYIPLLFQINGAKIPCMTMRDSVFKTHNLRSIASVNFWLLTTLSQYTNLT